MEHLFLNKKLSLIAKEKGFNEPCFAMWQKNGKIWYTAKKEWITNFVINPEPKTLKLHLESYPQNTRTINGVNYLESCSNFTAPLHQQIIDWFREKHNIEIEPKKYEEGYYFLVYKDFRQGLQRTIDIIKGDRSFICKTYEKAREKAIEEAFKLIP